MNDFHSHSTKGNLSNLFISYAREDDEQFVERLYRDLTERGFAVWWDREAMESRGRTFLQEIRDGMESADRVIAVIGPKAATSKYVRYEWNHACVFCKGIVPILRKGMYDLVPTELSGLHCPDFRHDRDYNKALAELVRILSAPLPSLGSFRGTRQLGRSSRGTPRGGPSLSRSRVSKLSLPQCV